VMFFGGVRLEEDWVMVLSVVSAGERYVGMVGKLDLGSEEGLEVSVGWCWEVERVGLLRGGR
jgi:hypothetical protein